jgi:hypothetical protein
MLSNRIAHLAPPPRRVPLPVACSAMLGLTGGTGAAFLIMGMPFVWLFVGDPGAPLWVCFVLIFPIVGAALFATATVRGLRQVALLRRGEVTAAQKISERATNTSVNNRPVIEYAYEFRAGDWQIYKGASRAIASEEISDEAGEPVLYLPSNPAVSVLVDALPLRYTLDVDDDGQWVSYESVWPVVWCGLAWLGIGAHVLVGLVRLFGGL